MKKGNSCNDFRQSLYLLKFSLHIADVAQLVEQLIRNEQVTGSSPVFGSI